MVRSRSIAARGGRWSGRAIRSDGGAAQVGLQNGWPLAVALLLLAGFPRPAAASEAEGAGGTAGKRPAAAVSEMPAPGDIQLAEDFEEFVSGGCPPLRRNPCRPWGSAPALGVHTETALRAGWWTAVVDGSPSLIGEYQDLQSSPFWDVDRVWSDGLRATDLTLTGTDNETTHVDWHYAEPAVRASVTFDRFRHTLAADPLSNFPQAQADPARPGSYLPVDGDFLAENLNAGEDYAIRVQQLKAKFQGKLAEQVRWRLNVWGQRKSGERQVAALSDCFDHPQIAGDARQCHVLSRRQQIDWLTMELEPGVEAKWGPVTLSYSRPMRSFNQNDQTLTRLYNSYPPIFEGESMPPQLGSEAYPDGAYYPYAIVPENFTQTDKLKIGIEVTDTSEIYALLYHGSTENQHRDFARDFGGFDLRYSDRSAPGLKWSGYARLNYETNQLPTTLISGETLAFDRYDETNVPCTWSDSRQYGGCGCEPVVVPCVVGEDGVNDFFASSALVPLIDYTRTTLGVNGRWTPFREERTWRRGLAFYGRYEYRLVARENAVSDVTLAPAVVEGSEQPITRSHVGHIGVSHRWSRSFDTFVRYTIREDSHPLYAVRSSNGTTNSSLPTDTDLVEIGGTWSPAAHFVAHATFGLQNSRQDSTVADFDEDSYPLTVTVWYAPTPALSFSAGYAYFTNWIQQAITLGDDFSNSAPYAPVTRNWNYGGRYEVWSLGGTYAWTRCLRLLSNLQHVRGRNEIATTVFDEPYVWPEIAEVVRDGMDSIRLSAGFDYRVSSRTSAYFRYSYLEYDDSVQRETAGAAHLFLAGVNSRY